MPNTGLIPKPAGQAGRTKNGYKLAVEVRLDTETFNHLRVRFSWSMVYACIYLIFSLKEAIKIIGLAYLDPRKSVQDQDKNTYLRAQTEVRIFVHVRTERTLTTVHRSRRPSPS